MAELVIGDHNWQQYAEDQHVDGERKSRGLVPRNWDTHPRGCYPNVQAVDFPVIPSSEHPQRARDKETSKSRLSDLRLSGAGGPKFPSLDQNGVGYCFPAGTTVRMADGTQKRIEDVRLLDEVLTAEGNIHRVMQCHVREHKGALINLKLWGHSHLRMTPNHEVLTERGYVPAGELRADDYVRIPRFAPEPARFVQTAGHVKGVLRRIKDKAGLATFERTMPKDGDMGYNPVPDFIELNDRTGYIFGLWLAEGYGTTWAFHKDEEHTLVAKLIRLLRDEWGVEAHTKPAPSSDNGILVVFCGVMWEQLLQSLCGKGAGGKRIHADLLAGPKDFLLAMLRGWLDGDGCVKGKSRNAGSQTAATVSKSLAMAMYDIANYLGLRPSVGRQEPQKNRHAKTRRPTWHISFPVEPSGKLPCGYDYRVKVEDGCVWRRVRKVGVEPFSGTVYNIGVEGDNSYVAEGVSVHNCWGHSSTHGVQYVRLIMNQPVVPLSAYSVCATIKKGADEGGWGAQSLDFIAERGVMPQSVWPQKDRNYRQYDKPENWAQAALYKITEGWIDLAVPQYDRKLSFDQVITLLLSGVPVVVDFNWWSHSVLAVDAVDGSAQRHAARAESGKMLTLAEFEVVWGLNDPVTGGMSIRIQNSWGDSWSQQGLGVLTGSKAVPDGAVAPRLAVAA